VVALLRAVATAAEVKGVEAPPPRHPPVAVAVAAAEVALLRVAMEAAVASTTLSVAAKGAAVLVVGPVAAELPLRHPPVAAAEVAVAASVAVMAVLPSMAAALVAAVDAATP
jgi:hypothetical protein